MMHDYNTAYRQQFIRQQSSHAIKLADAIAYLKQRGKHCFTTPLSKPVYTPLHGKPMEICK